MKGLNYHNHAVSNVIGYLLTFLLTFGVMIVAIVSTQGLIDEKYKEIADELAQSVANKVADSIVEAVSVRESMPKATYKKTLDVPWDLLGRNYYIEVTDDFVYVNTSDGVVSKKAPTYTAKQLSIGSYGKVYSGSGKLDIYANEPDYVYKLDFGTGSILDHSPVKSDYSYVSNTSSINPDARYPPWWNTDYKYRVPIRVDNNETSDITETPIEIVLDATTFNYDLANITFFSTSEIMSDLVFYEHPNTVTATIVSLQDTWNLAWRDDPRGTVQVVIGDLDGYTVDKIVDYTVKMNREVPCVGGVLEDSNKGGEYGFDDPNVAIASFNRRDAIRSLGDFLPPEEYEIVVSGVLNDGSLFYGIDTIGIGEAFNNILYVNKSYTTETLGFGITRFKTV